MTVPTTIERHNPLDRSYAQRVSALIQATDRRFGAVLADEVNQLVRSIATAHQSRGTGAISKIERLIANSKIGEDEVRQAMAKLRATVESSKQSASFAVAYEAAAGMKTDAHNFVTIDVPTMHGVEIIEAQGSVGIGYTDQEAFATAVRRLRPDFNVSFNTIENVLTSQLRQQYAFVDPNGVPHQFQALYTRGHFEEGAGIVTEALDAAKTPDVDGLIELSPLSGEVFIKMVTDAPDELERRQAVVENWLKIVAQRLSQVPLQEQHAVVCRYMNVEGDLLIDVQIGNIHYATTVLTGDAHTPQSLLSKLPTWLRAQSMTSSLDWLTTFHLVE